MIKQSNCLFSWKPFPTTWISILLTVLLFPLGLILPAWWGWENGPLENTQIVILGVGLIISCLAAQHNRDNRNFRNLWLSLIPFWLLIIGRELSWGRVSYPVALGPNGPEFISLYQLWYGRFIRPIAAIVILTILTGICLNSPLKYIRQTTLPLLDIGILCIMAILASAFDKSAFSLLHAQEEVLEEWAELTAYWSLVSIAVVSGFTKPSLPPLIQVKAIRKSHYPT